MDAPPIILVPGFWLGAWAWDEVADALRSEGHDVIAVTLPGLETSRATRSWVAWRSCTDVTYVDLPTSHWPMWSRPHELATIISDISHRAVV